MKSEIIEAIKALAKEKMDALMAEGQETSQQKYDEAIAEAEAQCAALADVTREKQAEMINLIVERVKSSVN